MTAVFYCINKLIHSTNICWGQCCIKQGTKSQRKGKKTDLVHALKEIKIWGCKKQQFKELNMIVNIWEMQMKYCEESQKRKAMSSFRDSKYWINDVPFENESLFLCRSDSGNGKIMGEFLVERMNERKLSLRTGSTSSQLAQVKGVDEEKPCKMWGRRPGMPGRKLHA